MVKLFDITKEQRRALAFVTAFALLFGAWFLKGYFSLVVVAALFAFLFNPLYKKLLKKNSSGKAAAITLIVSFFAVIIPVGIVIFISSLQVDHFIRSIQEAFKTIDPHALLKQIVDTINKSLDSLPFGNAHVTEDSLKHFFTEAAQDIGVAVGNFLKGTLPNIFSIITLSITYIFVFVSLLKNQQKLTDMFRALNPLGPEISDLYLFKMASMVKGAVRGQFAIAVVQGFTDAALIYLGGLHNAFFFFFMILTALSIVPLGGGILAIPVGIIMALTGNVWGGVLVVGGHLLITTNEDNIMRPRLVPQEARLDSALMLLSVFSGIALFGFLGIVIGPVIMILIVTTVQVYLEVFKDIEALDRKKAQKPPGLIAKVGNFTRRLRTGGDKQNV